MAHMLVMYYEETPCGKLIQQLFSPSPSLDEQRSLVLASAISFGSVEPNASEKLASPASAMLS